MSRVLVTDLYQLNMAASFLRLGMAEPATFSLFVRRLPPDRGFLVAAGLEACLAFLEALRFEPEDLDYLAGRYDETTLEAFAGLRFTGDVWAVPEGQVVLADEPILEVTAPVAEAQLVETYLLNQVTFQTAIATKAARCRLAAGEQRQLADFSLRRTHGTEAGMAVARLSALAGFDATSNVEAARRLGLRATGTMAHSYVEAFTSEADAFRAFARHFPDQTTFVVDTYDTLGGVGTAIDVIRELGLKENVGIRLDSGDLSGLARASRRLLDDAGLGHVRIVVSGGLDEYAIDRLVRADAPVDAFGVGTRLGVSADAPYLDSVYKLVAYGDRPVYKLSEGKATLPGAKQVFRSVDLHDDVLGLREEEPPPGHRSLLAPVMRGGERTGPPESLAEANRRLRADLGALPASALALDRPVAPSARLSSRLSGLRAAQRPSPPG